MGFLNSLKSIFTGKSETEEYLNGFSKTNHSLGHKLRLISEDGNIDSNEFMENLMITLIDSDLGYHTAEKVCDAFLKKAKHQKMNNEEVMDCLCETMHEIYNDIPDLPILYNEEGPTVILMVGVNGSGKTTTCAKLAHYYQTEGKSVAMVAADTFRAGAVQQLIRWGEKLSVPVISGKENEDPSSVIVEGCRYAVDHHIDVLLCDTAGRLQNKKNLMDELAKMKRVISKIVENEPTNTWLVLDSNTGQNGLSQAMLFSEATYINGIILTKMDGTAKGGIVLAIKDQCSIPVRFLTFGETENDLKPFDLDLYLYSILGDREA